MADRTDIPTMDEINSYLPREKPPTCACSTPRFDILTEEEHVLHSYSGWYRRGERDWAEVFHGDLPGQYRAHADGGGWLTGAFSTVIGAAASGRLAPTCSTCQSDVEGVI
ncbi:MAG: hypothetical protein AAGN46_05595 [Acidobacteriota bacterium]